MKILFVAMPFSLHTARWIAQLENKGFDIHFFPSMGGQILHENIKGITYHENFFELPGRVSLHNSYNSILLKPLSFVKTPFLKKAINKSVSITGMRLSRAASLKKIILKVKPDIIHSLEMQHAGYIVREAKKNISNRFPLWIHSNWGIDLHFFGQLQKHVPLIKETLSMLDVFITEGKRDEILARQFGFKGTVYTFPSVGGGFVFSDTLLSKTSLRKKILVKGTQDIVRRALVALRALERCIDVIEDYEIILYSSNEITQAAAESFFYRTGKRITVLNDVSHHEMMQLNLEARLSLCVNMSDGLPNSMLEAMIAGAFPIQSNTSLADEWLINEKTGMLVPPEDPDIIEMAIRKSLKEDRMVDEAAVTNRNLIRDKLEYHATKTSILKMYKEAYTSHLLPT